MVGSVVAGRQAGWHGAEEVADSFFIWIWGEQGRGYPPPMTHFLQQGYTLPDPSNLQIILLFCHWVFKNKSLWRFISSSKAPHSRNTKLSILPCTTRCIVYTYHMLCDYLHYLTSEYFHHLTKKFLLATVSSYSSFHLPSLFSFSRHLI